MTSHWVLGAVMCAVVAWCSFSIGFVAGMDWQARKQVQVPRLTKERR